MKSHIATTMSIFVASCTCLSVLISWTAKSPVPAVDAKQVEASVVKGFQLLQTSGALFVQKARCASCHHTTMTSMIAETMARKGVVATDSTAHMREGAEVGTLDFVGNPNINSRFVSAKFLTPYVLIALAAEKHRPDFSTDNSVNYIISQALPDGHFQAEYSRVPFEYGDIHLTALSLRAIALYAPQGKSTRIQSLLKRGKDWMENQHTTDQQELAFQLMGLQWSGSDQAKKLTVAKQLVAKQNTDGGWSQLPTMKSDAYATGQTLYALLESGTYGAASETCTKAIEYLLHSQDQTGAWVVNTRSNPIQPFVNSNFPPYDDNQFISAAATNWAALALASSLPDKNNQ